MNVLLKAFIMSFLFFSLLLFALVFGEHFMNKQGVSYPPILKRITNSYTASSVVLPTPIPAAVIGNGDADANSSVDYGDIKFISGNWDKTAGGSIDQYQDGKVNSLDFAVVANRLSK